MAGKGRQCIRIMLVAAVAVAFMTIGAGFYRNLFADSEETYKGLKLFSDVIEIVEKNYAEDVDSKELIEKAIQGMVSSLDPHSQFLPPEAFEDLQVDTKGEFGGIGIVITMRDGVPTVISPIEGTPAYRAGIKAGDMIIKVNGESTKELMLWESVRKMRGPKGTEVVLTIFRKSSQEALDFALVRDIIPIGSVKWVVLKPGYGYVWITNFQDNTTDKLETALQKLESLDPPLKGLILDLRDNPGGLLNQAVSVSDLFLDEGNIVSIKGRQKKNTKRLRATPNDVPREYPMVVLIKGGSASASEIVAGALQDHKRALILGTTSFGKGSVQTVESLREGYGLKFTIALYYTPDDRSIQAQGIEPDIEVHPAEIPTAGETAGRTIKEKDLRNHLEAAPKTPADTPENEDQTPEQKENSPPKNPHGPLSKEKLMTDYQVQRALEILTGYDIFKNLNG